VPLMVMASVYAVLLLNANPGDTIGTAALAAMGFSILNPFWIASVLLSRIQKRWRRKNVVLIWGLPMPVATFILALVQTSGWSSSVLQALVVGVVMAPVWAILTWVVIDVMDWHR